VLTRQHINRFAGGRKLSGTLPWQGESVPAGRRVRAGPAGPFAGGQRSNRQEFGTGGRTAGVFPVQD